MSTANFCDICNNLMRFETETVENTNTNEESEELIISCWNCNNKAKYNGSLVHQEVSKEKDFDINLNYKYDRTLPRTFNMTCVNKQCPTSSRKNPEVVYFSRNKDNRLGFICTECDTYWH